LSCCVLSTDFTVIERMNELTVVMLLWIMLFIQNRICENENTIVVLKWPNKPLVYIMICLPVLPRAMLWTERTILSQDVRPSDGPSVTRRYSIETAKHINLFPPSGSQTNVVFRYKTLFQHSDGDPLSGASKGVWENRDFLVYPLHSTPVTRFISEMIQDRAIVTIADL